MSKQLTIKEERRKKRKNKQVKDSQEENIDVTQTTGYLSSTSRYLYWLLGTSVRKNGSLAVANVLVLISFLLKRYTSNRGRSKEHPFPFLQTTTNKLDSEVEFLSPRHVLHTQIE
jgi:hypothetical protein